jgi:Transposase DDE domain
LRGYLQFPCAAQVFRLQRHRIDLHQATEECEVVFGVTSLAPAQANPAQLLALNRHHWGIENKLHYVRDVTFDEDRSRVRKQAGPHVMASLRNLAISLLRMAGADNIAAAVRACGRQETRALRLLGIAVA